MNRRRCFSCITAFALAGCAGESVPQRWYRLPRELPAGEAVPRAPAATGAMWELASPLPIPELLNREPLLVEEGAAGVRLLYGHRWAEPLRDALPPLLRHDLALLVPGPWAAAAAPGAARAGSVKVELLALQGNLQRQQVLWSARWVVTAPSGASRAFSADEAVPWADTTSVEALVVAQRVAMWRLAQRIAASLPGG